MAKRFTLVALSIVLSASPANAQDGAKTDFEAVGDFIRIADATSEGKVMAVSRSLTDEEALLFLECRLKEKNVGIIASTDVLNDFERLRVRFPDHPQDPSQVITYAVSVQPMPSPGEDLIRFLRSGLFLEDLLVYGGPVAATIIRTSGPAVQVSFGVRGARELLAGMPCDLLSPQ